MEKITEETIRTKLSSIKKLLLGEEEREEVQLEDAKLVDGTIVRIEPAVEVGATVQVIGEDGELLDAPDADHELEDGRIIKTEGGIILEVIEVEGEEEVVEEEMSEEEATAEPTLEDKLLEKVNELVTKHREDLDAKIAGLKFAKSEKVETLEADNKKLKETLVEVVEMFEKFSESEKETPKKTPTKAWMSKEPNKVDYSKLKQNLK